ncbi:hypothetical protein PVMG_04864 [Plasmodium vivax Mauritania I]|uniref:PIR Superfamily Protein n=1 Tax=Plasmodium vivax Mauritania I TaxID=1035515 RepID=A0A0J9T8X0_PLAVI|nr:hypothetical protein PVMG_04864 [Plasmodium vivax Mauritania I]
MNIVNNEFKYNVKTIKDEDQIPYEFYSRLDIPENASNLKNFIPSEATLIFVDHNESKEILAQLARNIKLIVSNYPKNYVKRCRDINYWMNEKIKTPENRKLVSDLKTSCYSVFNYIKWNKGGSDEIVCKRNEEPYKTNNVEIMKKLDDYCEIRDNIRCDTFKNYEDLLRYNTHIKQKRQYFRNEMQEYNYNLDNIKDKRLSIAIYDKNIINKIFKYKYNVEYDFFKRIDEYIKNEQEAEKAFLPVETSEACNSFKDDSNFLKITNPEIICKIFKNLFNTLSSFKRNLQSSPHYDNDCRFINYWLNDKLRKDGTNDSNYVKIFYDKLQEDKVFDTDKLLKNKIYDINYGDLKNLRILYNLYVSLYKIIDKINNEQGSQNYTCSFHTSICIEEYKAAKIACNDESSIFCRALDDFRDSYLSIPPNPKGDKGCNLSTSGKLPTDEEILSYRNIALGGKSKNNMVVSLIGSVFCFSFTFMLFYRVK